MLSTGDRREEKGWRRQKQNAFLSPDLGEDFFQIIGALGMQLKTGFFYLLGENACILRTNKTKCRLQIRINQEMHLKEKPPGVDYNRVASPTGGKS